MPHGLGVPEIVDRDDLEPRLPLEMSPKEVPPDPPESVDPNPGFRHGASLWGPFAAASGSARCRSERRGSAGSRHGPAEPGRTSGGDEAGRRGSSEDDLPPRVEPR